MNYDIIGDIHGQADQLISLLTNLGYQQVSGVYQKTNHQAIFVGDFIDRGKQQKEVINIVRPMVESQAALAVMGNHEFNAICYHSYEPNNTQYLRKHTDKNTNQHKAFLNDYPLGDPETEGVINWFKSLPLFLELDSQFRIIHACWDQQIIEYLVCNNYLNSNHSLKVEFFPLAAQKGHALFDALEIILKGKEIKLPARQSFLDKDNNTRHEIRIKWWQNNLKTYQQASVMDIPSLTSQADILLPSEAKLLSYPCNEIPVFFGHYWFTGELRCISDNAVCVDYSAVEYGDLVAYCWRENSYQLQNDCFMKS